MSGVNFNLLNWLGFPPPEALDLSQPPEQPFPLGDSAKKIQNLFINTLLPPYLSSQGQACLGQLNRFTWAILGTETHQRNLIEKALLEELKKCIPKVDFNNLGISFFFEIISSLIPYIPENSPILFPIFQLVFLFQPLEIKKLLKRPSYMDQKSPQFRKFLNQETSIEAFEQNMVLEIKKPTFNLQKLRNLKKSCSALNPKYSDGNYFLFSGDEDRFLLVIMVIRIHFFPNEAEEHLQIIDQLVQKIVAKNPDQSFLPELIAEALLGIVDLTKLTPAFRDKIITDTQRLINNHKTPSLEFLAIKVASFDLKRAFRISPEFSHTVMHEEELAEAISLLYKSNPQEAQAFIENYYKDPFSKCQLLFIKDIAPIFPKETKEFLKRDITRRFNDPRESISLLRAILILGSIQPDTLIPNLIKFQSFLNETLPSQPKKGFFSWGQQPNEILIDKIKFIKKWGSNLAILFEIFPQALFNYPKTIIQLCRTSSLKLSAEVKLCLLIKTINASHYKLKEQVTEIFEPLFENLKSLIEESSIQEKS